MQLDDACIKIKLFIGDLPVMVQKIDEFSRLSSVLGELHNKPSLSMYPMSKNIPSTNRDGLIHDEDGKEGEPPK